MKNNKKLKRNLLIVLLHLLGFPILLLLVIRNAKIVVEYGKTYGIFAYVGIILMTVFVVVYYVIFLIMNIRKRKSPIRQAITLSVLTFLMFAGLFLFISKAAPDKLLQITSGTISYEDLVDQRKERAKVNKKLMNDFIFLNTFANGNLVFSDSEVSETNSNVIIYPV